MSRSSDALQPLAREQCDVLSRAQLLRLGVDRHMIARRESSGAWRVLGPRVVVLHTGTLTTRARWWVGVLHADLADDDAADEAKAASRSEDHMPGQQPASETGPAR